ncbi:hypothetical protein ACN47E_005481 [Coniothyrium glycines]
MFFFFTCGTHTFTSKLSGAEHITVQCQNCGNFSGRVLKRWQWFTFCFVPVIPFSLKPYREVGCHICNFWQDVKYRPDVMQQLGGGGGGGGSSSAPAVMMAGANGNPNPNPNAHAGPAGGAAPPQGVPLYK